MDLEGHVFTLLKWFVECTCKIISSWYSLCWEHFYYQFKFITSNLYVLIVFSWFSLRKLYILNILSISPRMSNFWHIIFSSYFIILCISVVVTPLFWFYLLESPLFFSCWVWLKVFQLCLYFQRFSSYFDWSFVLFLSLHFIYFCLHYYFFLYPNFGLYSSFLVSFF